MGNQTLNRTLEKLKFKQVELKNHRKIKKSDVKNLFDVVDDKFNHDDIGGNFDVDATGGPTVGSFSAPSLSYQTRGFCVRVGCPEYHCCWGVRDDAHGLLGEPAS